VKEKAEIVLFERIERCIYLIRGQKIMLSSDLAVLYGVEPKVLVQAVKRNNEGFPADFMFQLAPQEFTNLKSQIVISSWGGIRRATPYALTEQGVAMLSSVLNSRQAEDSSEGNIVRERGARYRAGRKSKHLRNEGNH
jgi:hypothetical protein